MMSLVLLIAELMPGSAVAVRSFAVQTLVCGKAAAIVIGGATVGATVTVDAAEVSVKELDVVCSPVVAADVGSRSEPALEGDSDDTGSADPVEVFIAESEVPQPAQTRTTDAIATAVSLQRRWA